jgi:cytochrome c-type biogenesis protein CcmH/NrfG
MCAAVASLVLSACASTPRHNLSREAALQQQAAMAYRQGDMPQALTGYRKLANNLPDDNATWFRLGNVYAHLNQPEAAAKAYRHVLQRDPDNAKAWHNLGVVYMHQAAAAFVESARSAGEDHALRKQSMNMANQLEEVAKAGRVHGASAQPTANGKHATISSKPITPVTSAAAGLGGANP